MGLGSQSESQKPRIFKIIYPRVMGLLRPLLGNYTIQFLNQNKQVILNLMTSKANEYANFKTLRSYVISIFDWAEELEYIEANRVAKTLRRIKAVRKI